MLKGISTEIAQGEVLAIIGPSGSGKSTFLRCINMLETPTDGRISFKDQVITDKKTNIMKVRENVGMVFQHFHLFPHKTVLENLTYAPMKVKKLSKGEAVRQARELLTKVGLAEKESSYPNRLSGGKNKGLPLHGHWP